MTHNKSKNDPESFRLNNKYNRDMGFFIPIITTNQKKYPETFEKIMGWFDPGVYNMILAKLNELEETSMSGGGPGGGLSGLGGICPR